ncbi:MAG: hypothetical protein JXA69_15120 [Phycisphaerae bacterium]|nr:hypothetical protein [Phycisphaerae bacterium]
MSVEGKTPTAARCAPAKSALHVAGAFYFLAAALQTVLLVLCTAPPIVRLCYWLAWQLSPYGSLPFPYDIPNGGWGLIPEEPGSSLAILAAFTLAMTLVVAATHSLVFAIAVGAHAWLGWPSYWRDVRPRLGLQSLWAASARRTWWAWPAGQCVWLFLLQIDSSSVYDSYLVIDASDPFLAANIAAIALMMGLMTGHTVRQAIVGAVGPDDCRCNYCGYLLRGLETPRCPECGHVNPPHGDTAYRLRLPRLGLRTRTRTALASFLIAAILLSPLLLPTVLTHLPRPWKRYVPQALRSTGYDYTPDPDRFPIRLDAICVIRHDGAIVVVDLTHTRTRIAAYRALYWSDAQTFGPATPPDRTFAGTINTLTDTARPTTIGPWPIWPRWGNETMFWLMRPDNTYSIEAYERDRLPEELQWINRSEP